MTAVITSVRNHNESAVYLVVSRHTVDVVFHPSERKRVDSEHLLCKAVEYAFGFVQARTAMSARA